MVYEVMTLGYIWSLTEVESHVSDGVEQLCYRFPMNNKSNHSGHILKIEHTFNDDYSDALHYSSRRENLNCPHVAF